MSRRTGFYIHPLSLVSAGAFIILGQGRLLLTLLAVNAFQKIGQALFLQIKMSKLPKKIMLTPLGLRLEGGYDEAPYRLKILFFLTGSISGVALAIALFALEMKYEAGLSLLLAALRLTPLIPFSGGRIITEILGKRLGILRAAVWMSRIGCGAGMGLCLFSMGLFIIQPLAIVLLCMGLYIIYANRREVRLYASRLFHALLRDKERPVREKRIRGNESPGELLMAVNQYEETVFIDNNGGVTQEKVFLAVLTGRGGEWLRSSKKSSCKSSKIQL